MENKNFRPDIEGLRGVAILLVVAYHAGVPGFTGGYIGVDVFFVLSGYLITGLLVAEREKKGKISLANFYARRARRLLPASAIMLLFAMIAAYIVFAPYEQTGVFKSAASTALYVSNLHFLIDSANYFADAPETNLFLHTWSLSVEEQFYFVFPLLLLLALKYGTRQFLLIIIAIGGVVSFILSVYLTSYFQPWAFFSSPTRAWEFAAGALGVMIGGAYSKRIGYALALIGLLLILGAACFYGSSTQFPGWAALLPVLGTIFILHSGSDTQVGKLLSSSLLQFFGKLSYSFYLWHWVVLVFAAAIWEGLSLTARLACILVSLGVAQISYTFVENPVRFNPILSRRPVFGLLMAGILTLIGASISFTFYRHAQATKILPEQVAFLKAIEHSPAQAQKCEAKAYESILKECVFGNPDSDKIVVLVGDSHLQQWFLPIREIAETENWRLITLFKGACTPTDVVYFYKPVGRRFYECEQWRAQAFARIKEIHPYLVIASGYERVSLSHIDVPPIPLNNWVEGLNRTFDSLNASGAKAVYLRDTPHPDFNPLTCMARRAWQPSWLNLNGSCSFKREKALNVDLAEVEKRVADSKGVSYIDMNDYICPGNICDPVQGDTVIYRDHDHLTNVFALKLGTSLRYELQNKGLIKTVMVKKNKRQNSLSFLHF